MRIRATLPAMVAAGFFVLLGGCSISREGLDTHDDAESQQFSDNYEEIFRRLSVMGEKCYPRGQDRGNAGNRLSGAIESEGELHKDRGSADFRLAVSSLSVRTNYFLSARIEKAGSGSRVTTKVNNPLLASGLSKILFRWAGGDQSC
jgi:hypothetical protein